MGKLYRKKFNHLFRDNVKFFKITRKNAYKYQWWDFAYFEDLIYGICLGEAKFGQPSEAEQEYLKGYYLNNKNGDFYLSREKKNEVNKTLISQGMNKEHVRFIDEDVLLLLYFYSINKDPFYDYLIRLWFKYYKHYKSRYGVEDREESRHHNRKIEQILSQSRLSLYDYCIILGTMWD